MSGGALFIECGAARVKCFYCGCLVRLQETIKLVYGTIQRTIPMAACPESMAKGLFPRPRVLCSVVFAAAYTP